MINSLVSRLIATLWQKNMLMSISGRTQYMDLDTREVYEYRAGDFFATFPGTTYVQKSEAGTKMNFCKRTID